MADKALKKKMTDLGYPDFETKPGQEDVLMLYVASRLICSVAYALEMPDEQLKALIDETVKAVEEGEQD